MVLRLTQQIRCVPVQNKHGVKLENERERSNSDYTAARTYLSLLLILPHTGRKMTQMTYITKQKKCNLRVQKKDLISVLDTVRGGGGRGGWGERETGRDPKPCLDDQSKCFDYKELNQNGIPSRSVLASHSR